VRTLRTRWTLGACCVGIAALAGCATPVIVIKPEYYAQPIKTAAFVGFNDAANVPNSGSNVEGVFARYLTATNQYTLIGLDEAQQAISAKHETLGNLQDPSNNAKLGKFLGADAVISGWITQYTDTSEATVIVDEPQTETETIFRSVPVVNRDGSIGSRSRQFTRTITADNYVPETQTLPARVGIGLHMVSAKTGTELWSASYTGDGSNLPAATENAAAQITQTLQEDLGKHKVITANR
jgi:hypothetical protein